MRLARLRVSQQLVLELRQLVGAVANELELAVDVAERLAEQLAAALGVDVVATQLRAHLGARLLGAEQRLELVERHAEQLFQADQLAQTLDLGVGVQAVRPAGLAGASGSRPISS